MTRRTSGFKARRLPGAQTLGERLQQLRQEAGIELDAAARQLGIPRHHLRSLEGSAYDRLPGEVYIRNFLKRYTAFLNVSETSVLKAFTEEFSLTQRVTPARRQAQAAPPRGLPRQWQLTPIAFRRIAFSLLVTAILVYLGWEVSKIVAPPTLALTSPPENFVTAETVITVAGHTKPEAIVSINDQAIFVDQQGGFRETIVLETGLNTIVVAAKKQRSRERVIFRQVLLESSNQ